MTEPSAKRARRPDATTMWEKPTPSSSRNDQDRPSKNANNNNRKQDSSHTSTRRPKSHSRSPSRERQRDRGGDNNTHKRGGGGRGGGARDRDDRPRLDRDDQRGTKRGRSRSPETRNPSTRQRSPPRGPRGGGGRARDEQPHREREAPPKAKTNEQHVGVNGKDAGKMDVDVVVGDDDSDAAMQRMLGFKSFRSTKNTKVPGNDKNYGVRKEKKTEYRQYMNRQGGFNRPLSPG